MWNPLWSSFQPNIYFFIISLFFLAYLCEIHYGHHFCKYFSFHDFTLFLLTCVKSTMVIISANILCLLVWNPLWSSFPLQIFHPNHLQVSNFLFDGYTHFRLQPKSKKKQMVSASTFLKVTCMSPVSPVFHTVVTVSIGLKNVLRMVTSIL